MAIANDARVAVRAGVPVAGRRQGVSENEGVMRMPGSTSSRSQPRLLETSLARLWASFHGLQLFLRDRGPRGTAALLIRIARSPASAAVSIRRLLTERLRASRAPEERGLKTDRTVELPDRVVRLQSPAEIVAEPGPSWSDAEFVDLAQRPDRLEHLAHRHHFPLESYLRAVASPAEQLHLVEAQREPAVRLAYLYLRESPPPGQLPQSDVFSLYSAPRAPAPSSDVPALLSSGLLGRLKRLAETPVREW